MKRRYFIKIYLWWNFKNFCGRSGKKKCNMFCSSVEFCYFTHLPSRFLFSATEALFKADKLKWSGLVCLIFSLCFGGFIISLVWECGSHWHLKRSTAYFEWDRKLCLSSTHCQRKRTFKSLLLLSLACFHVMLWLWILHKICKIKMGPIYSSQLIHQI